MLRNTGVLVLVATMLAGCVYEKEEPGMSRTGVAPAGEQAGPPPGERPAARPAAYQADRYDEDRYRTDRYRSDRYQADRSYDRPGPNRVRASDLNDLSPGAGTPGPQAAAPRVPREPPYHARHFVQAASMVTRDQAERVRRSLRGLGPTTIYTAYVEDQLRYRVRIGPFASPEDSERVRLAAIRRGFADAIILRD